MTIFKDKRLTRTDCDEAGDFVVPNVLSPRNLVFRPDIGQKKLYHHRLGRIASAQTNKQIIKNEMCCSGLASFSTIVQSYWSRRCLVATGSSILLKKKSRSKESHVRAIENKQYVNGSTVTDGGADCRFIIRFVIFFLIIFVEVCIRCIYILST